MCVYVGGWVDGWSVGHSGAERVQGNYSEVSDKAYETVLRYECE